MIQNNFTKKFSRVITKSTLKILVVVFFVVLLAFGGGFIYFERIRKTNNLASLTLSKAYSAFDKGDRQLGTTLLDEVIAKYPKTSATYHAKLYRADIFTELQSYDEALSILKEIETKATVQIIRPLALVRIIYIYDSKKDYSNAITTSKEFINKYPKHFLIRDIYLNLAEYYLATGLKDEAIKTFNEILISFPTTQEATKAQKRINEIK